RMIRVTDLLFSSIPQLQDRLRRRQISAEELARAALERAAGVAPRYNALVELMVDSALADARVADRRLREGSAGPLCGIPYGVKDAIATAGVPTRWGAPPFSDQVFDYDATVVTRLR